MAISNVAIFDVAISNVAISNVAMANVAISNVTISNVAIFDVFWNEELREFLLVGEPALLDLMLENPDLTAVSE